MHEMETARLEIKTVLPEIEINALPLIQSAQQARLDFRQVCLDFRQGSLDFRQGSLDFR